MNDFALGSAPYSKLSSIDILKNLKESMKVMRDYPIRQVRHGPVFIPGCSDEAFGYAHWCHKLKIHTLMSPQQYDKYLEWLKRTGKIDE